LIYRSVAALKPDPRNARTHPKRQIEQLVRSIKEFGFTNPILIDDADTLIAGHGRLRAAKEVGLSDVPTITLEGLSEAQKKALRLADNKIALNAGWDLEILKLELDEIGTLDVEFDLALTGFSSGEVDVVLRAANDPDDEVIQRGCGHAAARYYRSRPKLVRPMPIRNSDETRDLGGTGSSQSAGKKVPRTEADRRHKAGHLGPRGPQVAEA
jgi:ParB-like chromosome segregation protein Spo0J